MSTGQACGGCRYWSDLVARGGAGISLEALCLSDKSEHRGDYTAEKATCPHWAAGDLGAVDQPGADPMRYRRREAAS